MDLSHRIRLTAAMGYAYLNMGGRADDFIGKSLFSTRLEMSTSPPIDISVDGLRCSGVRLKCNE